MVVASPSSRKAPTVIQLERGGLSMSLPAPRVFDFRAWGYFEIELAERMLEFLEKGLDNALGRFVAFQDWDAMTSYDTRARLRLTAWVLKNSDRFDGIHILTNSALVSMGVSVANMALGRFITTYGPAERDRYISALREAVDHANQGQTNAPPSVRARAYR